jgi:uncharacterized RDD family membrane protein YckC
MVTGFDYLGRDKTLQEHWIRRFAAIVIDWLIIFIPLSLIGRLVGGWGTFGFLPLSLTSVLFFLYCALFDYAIGGTLGKMLLGLKSVSVTGKMDIAQAIMRNISKIFLLILLIDWIVGMAVDTTDPRQKWTDRLVNTSVILISRPAA